MGQAKRRGTFEQRKQAAILERKERQLREAGVVAMREKYMSAKERQKRQSANNSVMQLLSMMAGLSSGARIVK